MSAHTPGPWRVVENHPTIRIHFSLPDGRESGVAVSIGSTALHFRAPRQGSHRGETMVYRPFAEHDRANARLIAAAPDLLDALKACRRLIDTLGLDPVDHNYESILEQADSAIMKAKPIADGAWQKEQP